MNRLLEVLAVLVLFTACDAALKPSPTVTDPGPIVTAPSPWTGPSDWPGPLRVEPAEGASTVRMDDLAPGVSDLEPYRFFTDARADIDGPVWLDITTVAVSYIDLEGNDYVSVSFDLAGHHPLPIPERSEEWIAYGLVVDVDGDGTADVRFGIDNLSSEEHRVWRTDLATGETEHHDGPPHGPVADTWYPGQHQRHGMAGSFSIERLPAETEFRFYVWASEMQGSQVVATDYAPDQGWIDRPEADR